MENEPCRRSSALQEPFHWKSAGGRPDVSPARKRTPSRCCSLSAALLEFAHFFETWSYSKRARSLNIWPSLNTEPALSQISEETLESLKLHEKNFECQTTPEPTKQQQKDIPRVTSRDKDTRNSFKPQISDHFNLKASIKQPLFRRIVSYLSLK